MAGTQSPVQAGKYKALVDIQSLVQADIAHVAMVGKFQEQSSRLADKLQPYLFQQQQKH
jgi:uncharacterized protein (DUF4213/DUF364 family)